MATWVPHSARANLRQGTQPVSPHTPNRYISSTYSSPGSTFRQEEDAVIVELGSRYLRAGYEGESSPQCIATFGPEDSRRIGDYRGWSTAGPIEDLDIETWGRGHELWKMDTRGLDLGLVEDKIERAFREAYNQHLLADVGTARLILVVPSILPHTLISLLLTTLFNRWKYPSISLLHSPTMATAGAGLRSALVIDVGWSETIVTAIYEYREAQSRRSTRSMQEILKQFGRSLTRWLIDNDKPELSVGFELAEDLMARLAWCPTELDPESLESHQEETDRDTSSEPPSQPADGVIEVDWPTRTSCKSLKMPSKLFSYPVEKILLKPEVDKQHLDDEEHTLPMMVYETMLHLPPDARGICMSRLVFVGGGSAIPGLSQRVIVEVDALIKKHGWSGVRGSQVNKSTSMPESLYQERKTNARSRDKNEQNLSSLGQDADEDPVDRFLEEQILELRKFNYKQASPDTHSREERMLATRKFSHEQDTEPDAETRRQQRHMLRNLSQVDKKELVARFLEAQRLEPTTLDQEKPSETDARSRDEQNPELVNLGHKENNKPDARFRDRPLPGNDPIEQMMMLRRHRIKEETPIQGELREVESLGAWAGASLLASLKIKGFVEIEREKFLQHGLAGAQRDLDASTVPQRTSYGAGQSRGAADRTSWTLAGWA